MLRELRFLGLSLATLTAAGALGCGDRTGFDFDERAYVSVPLDASARVDGSAGFFPAEDADRDAATDDATDDGEPGGETDDGGMTGSPGSGGGGGGSGAQGILCDPVLGPIPANDPNGGADHACTPYYPHCVDLGDMWLCCRGPGPYDGPTGTCL